MHKQTLNVNLKEYDSQWYDKDCRDCKRLADFLDEVKASHEHYFCRPVPPFGPSNAQVLVVGLAPGLHGANATGRPFTGDYAGILLYQTLYDYGFASRAQSTRADDGLVLQNCRITNAVKCLPPQNKPTTQEEKNCNHFLAAELQSQNVKVIIALGNVAHRAVLRSFNLKPSQYAFGHNVEHALPDGRILIDSYHCSRYNTQTKRLTADMFADVFKRAKQITD